MMRRMFYCAMAAAILLFGLGSISKAEQVKVSGVHICCGGCVAGIEESLKETKGIKNLVISSKNKTVSFEAGDDETAINALTDLANGGYYGKVNRKGPDFKVDPKAEQNEVQLSGLHLCCPGCTSELKKSLEVTPSVFEISINEEEGTAVVKSRGDSKISLKEMLQGLHARGFHATMK